MVGTGLIKCNPSLHVCPEPYVQISNNTLSLLIRYFMDLTPTLLRNLKFESKYTVCLEYSEDLRGKLLSDNVPPFFLLEF